MTDIAPRPRSARIRNASDRSTSSTASSTKPAPTRPGSAPPPEEGKQQQAKRRKRSHTSDQALSISKNQSPIGQHFRHSSNVEHQANGINAELLCLEQILEEARRDELAAGNVPSVQARQTRPVDEDDSDYDKDIGEMNIFPVNEANPLSMELLSRARRKRTRTITTPYQTRVLRKVLALTAFPSTQMRRMLAEALNMNPRTVQIWYQNRRQKEKSNRVTTPPLSQKAVTARTGSVQPSTQMTLEQKQSSPNLFFHNMTVTRQEHGPTTCGIRTTISAGEKMDMSGLEKGDKAESPATSTTTPTSHDPLDMLAMAALDRARLDGETPTPPATASYSTGPAEGMAGREGSPSRWRPW
ncbi:uncharacterized protein VTP21DRAFT_166 [Calcarisporiella thermophila]|uniref:uncharacterized protein n=1 Tax=Calcarisporiella thermophila TaxID=911321 RepID=UPI003743106D